MIGREWLELAAGTVAFILGMFGGFLTGFAPPSHPLDPYTDFALGFGSLLMACVLLLIVGGVRVLGRKTKPRTWLIVASVFFVTFAVSGFVYHDYRDEHSFAWEGPEESHLLIAGDSLTDGARGYAAILREEGTTPTNEVLLREFGGPAAAADVWPEAAIDRVERRMEIGYLVSLLAVSACLFFLVEGLLPYARRPLQ